MSSYLYYDKINDLFKELKKFKYFSEWKIKTGKVQEKANSIKNSGALEFYKDKIRENTGHNPYNHQLVTIFDAISILKTVFESNTLLKEIEHRIGIIFEYIIPYADSKRIDVILTGGNRLLILEFSYTEDVSKSNIDKRIADKHEQNKLYKDMLERYLPNEIKISTHEVVYVPDLDIEENRLHNENTFNNLRGIINNFFKHDYSTFHLLREIEFSKQS